MDSSVKGATQERNRETSMPTSVGRNPEPRNEGGLLLQRQSGQDMMVGQEE